MGQKKLIRFEEIRTFPNVFEKPFGKRGTWNQFFSNENGITLELACGKGEYTVGLARMYPERNFIGIDIKGNRIWRGAKTAIDERLTNVAFIRSEILNIANLFAEKEVEEIWITFPDPQLRLSKYKKRLTHPRFLRLYKSCMVEGGKVHLKTDSPSLFRFTNTVIDFYGLKRLDESEDITSIINPIPELSIRTHYEGLNISGSNKTFYLSFFIDKEISLEHEMELKKLIDLPVEEQETEPTEEDGD